MSLVVIGMASAMAITATGAYFTEAVPLNDNLLYAGTVDINLASSTAQTVIVTPGTISGLVPGQYGPGSFLFQVYNQWGTIPVKYKISSVYTNQSVGGYWQLLWVKVRHNSIVVYEGLLNDLDINSVVNTNIDDFLNPGGWHDYYFEYGLGSTAGNGFQGAWAYFNLKVDATQSNNPGWTE